jgi:asparagine synthase (glutamine-hydrolysing)
MCGIAGFIAASFDRNRQQDVLRQMLDPIAHRGPDAEGMWFSAQTALGHRRLKIIDLSDSANQPFTDGDYTIVFNGEIYNYIEIRSELQSLGHHFVTQGDTEVIIKAYQAWGSDCVSRFMGMWAFAIWDSREEKLFCSRDRFGIKPFYYAVLPQGFFFSSEYKSFKALSFFDRSLNEQQLWRGIGMLWAGYYDQTFYKNLKQLEPASHLLWQAGKIQISSYWQAGNEEALKDLPFEEKVERFRKSFLDSVRLHSRSDVETGMNLSGGLDSSSIASAFAHLFPAQKVKAFTMYFTGAGGVDERPFVQHVLNRFPGIESHTATAEEDEVREAFEQLSSMADVPVFGSAYLSQYLVMKLARANGVTVLLNGQGADEYLAGYRHVIYRLVADALNQGRFGRAIALLSGLHSREGLGLKQTASAGIRSLAALGLSEQQIYQAEYRQFNSLLAQSPAPLQFEDPFRSKTNNALYHLLMHTTLPTLLHFEDRNSMAFSLESRVPFLDHRLVELSFALASSDKVTDDYVTKHILREAMKPMLPEAIYARKDKKGFVTPGELRWLAGPLSHLLEQDLSVIPGMRKDKLKALIADYKAGDRSRSKLVWSLAATCYWLRHHA